MRVWKAVLSLEFSASGSEKKADCRSIFESHLEPARRLIVSSATGMGYLSPVTSLFTLRRSTTGLHLPSAFGTTCSGEDQGPWPGSTMPASSSFRT